jgi:hypothetical protein
MASGTAAEYWNSIYAQCCDALLEPGGLQLGLLTTDQFYALAQEVLIDFYEKAGIVKKVFNIQMVSGTSTYAEPDAMSEADTALADQTYLHRSSGYYLDNSDPAWPLQSNTPTMFREDELPISQIQLSPTPNTSGNDVAFNNSGYGQIGMTTTHADFNITASTTGFGVIAGFSGNPYLEAVNPGFGLIAEMTVSSGNITAVGEVTPDGLEGILMLPPSFRLYLKYGILAKVFGSDSELKDMQKAAYCQARYAEGVNLATAIMSSDYTEVSPQ